MVVLVPSEEETFEVKGRQHVIDFGHRVRHAVVVGVFSLERKILVLANNGRDITVSPRIPHVCSNVPKIPGPIADQTKAEVVILGNRIRGAKEGSDKLSIEVWRPHG